MLEIQEYLDASGRSPFSRWFKGLDAQAAAKVAAALARMEGGNLGDVKSVGDGVLERRIHFGPAYRIYFGRETDRLIILLGGGMKQGQSRDIKAAKRRWLDYRCRQGEG